MPNSANAAPSASLQRLCAAESRPAPDPRLDHLVKRLDGAMGGADVGLVEECIVDGDDGP